MITGSITQRIGKWLTVAALLGCGLAMAQSEPTLKQVYETAQAGQLDQAQAMMQQVLAAHPNSAKAHFVQAELSARQGKISQAREALASAEKLAPGLPFATPEAVSALRAQLAVRSSPQTANSGSSGLGSWPVTKPTVAAAAFAAAPAAAPAFPWGLALVLVGGAIAIGMFMFRKKSTPALVPQAAYAGPGQMQGGLNGPQSFGMGNAATSTTGASNTPPGYPQPAGSGLGGRVVGGLATGLAVGAGVMAAEAIGKSLFGHDRPSAHQADTLASNNAYEPVAGNNDLGGENFGVNDATTWDDGNAIVSSGDGGGDWDS